ncbi:MAG: phage tail tape measure protein, partial [Candidatus Thorarchaeota archaeon]
ETFGEGNELSNVRLQELEGGFTKISGTIKAAGGATKQYTVYVNELGQVLKRLPVKEATVSVTDFHNALSGRVGALGNVNKMLERYGFQVSNLKKLTTEASTGITRLDFAMKSQGGATQKLTLHVTEFGKVLTDTQRRFRTFAGGIARNIGESFKWAVAITAVYGPLRKLQDLIQISIDNESKLADIGVVLGKTTSELQDIFEDAAQAAQATGESLNGVIEGYSLAYRATGNIANQTERAAVAQQLLIDSLVLSKLSSIEQAEAMDTLVAGLLQVGYNLDQGAELLNKWVAVSKAANVTVDTLATGFATMATAAEGVGLSFDEINAIIAVVAANTELSAKQAGNAVRAFVSGFQTKNAVEELSKYGIAVDTLEGTSRDFMDVMLDIKQLMDAGLINDAELNRLGTALGGRGARRGAQFTTFLKSLNEVQGLVAVSAEAQADAYDALGIKMETVQTAITNLATSFQVLANAVGTDGGVLDLLKGLIGVLDDVTKAATSFVGIMGKAAPFLAAAGGLYAYGRSTGRVQQFPGQLGGGITSFLGGTGFGQRPGFQQRGALGISGVGRQAGATGTTMAQAFGRQATLIAPALGTLMAQGALAYFNVKDKDWDGLGAQIGGGILGFMKGGPIGSIIGSTIAEALINGIKSAGESGELSDVFKGVFAEAADETADDTDTDLSKEEQLLQQREKLELGLIQAFGNEWEVGLQVLTRTAGDFIRDLVGIPRQWQRDLTGQQPGLQSGTDEQIEERIEFFREFLAEIEDIESQLAALGEGDFLPEGDAYTELQVNAEKYADVLENKLIQLHEEFRTSLVEGDITQKSYNESLERMGESGESILQVFTILNDIFGDNAKVLEEVADVVSRTSQEEIDYITTLTSGVDDLTEQINELEKEGDIDLKLIKEGELEEALFKLEQFFLQVRTAQREPLIQFDAPVDLDTRSLEDHRRVVAESMRILEEDMQENIRLGLIPSDTTIQEVLATHEAIAVAIAGKYVETMQIPMDVYKQAQENLAIPGRIAPPVSPEAGVSVRTIEQTQGAFLAAYEKQLQFLRDSFGDLYQGDFSTVGIIFKDGVDVLHLDNLAMQLAMDDLIDVNQKQLEGVYNLPTDSSFYVPFQGYRLGFGEGGGGGGGALDSAAEHLENAARSLEGLEGWGKTTEEVMREWFPQFMRDEKAGPSNFDLFAPRYDPLEMLGPEAPLIGGKIHGTQDFSDEGRRRRFSGHLEAQPLEETLIQKLERWADDLNNFLNGLFGIDEIQKQAQQSQPIPEPGTSTFFEKLFNDLFGFGTTSAIPGIGLGAGIGPTLEFSKLDSAATSLENVATLLQPQTQALGMGVGTGFGTSDVATEFSGMLDLLNQKISNLSGFTTNLKISSTSTTNLIVDGRTLAQVIKPYLYSDMIRFEDTAASVTKNIVV